MITESTTLSDLQLEAGKNGVSLITAKLEPGRVLAGLQYHNAGDTRFVVGEGETLFVALDKAFEIVRSEVAKQLQKEVSSCVT